MENQTGYYLRARNEHQTPQISNKRPTEEYISHYLVNNFLIHKDPVCGDTLFDLVSLDLAKLDKVFLTYEKNTVAFFVVDCFGEGTTLDNAHSLFCEHSESGDFIFPTAASAF